MAIRALFASLFALLIISPAMADADRVEALATRIAEESERRVAPLRIGPAAPAAPLDPSDTLLTELDEFALAALTLSRAIEARGGPEDLKCIFLGMSRDVSARMDALDAAQTRMDQARAYTQIARLARQAEEIAADPEAHAGTEFVSCGNR